VPQCRDRACRLWTSPTAGLATASTTPYAADIDRKYFAHSTGDAVAVEITRFRIHLRPPVGPNSEARCNLRRTGLAASLTWRGFYPNKAVAKKANELFLRAARIAPGSPMLVS
jgi:hypothetical protein